jgi:hypothetical protein
MVILLMVRFTRDESAPRTPDSSYRVEPRQTSVVIFRVKIRLPEADIGSMTSEQMIYRVQQAEHLLERYAELEREHEEAGLYEEALEARRLQLEQEAAASYWRERASETVSA